MGYNNLNIYDNFSASNSSKKLKPDCSRIFSSVITKSESISSKNREGIEGMDSPNFFLSPALVKNSLF
jgi:hypothetical protein